MGKAKEILIVLLMVLLAFWAFGNFVLIVADLAFNEQPGLITFGCGLNVIGCVLGVRHLAPNLGPITGPSLHSLDPSTEPQ